MLKPDLAIAKKFFIIPDEFNIKKMKKCSCRARYIAILVIKE